MSAEKHYGLDSRRRNLGRFRRGMVFVAAIFLFPCGYAVSGPVSFSPFFGIGYAYNKFHGEPQINYSAINVVGGLKFNRFISVEGEAAKGTTETLETVNGTTYRTKFEGSVAGYAIGTYPISKFLEAYARLGYVGAQIRADYASVRNAASESGPAYGFGLRLFPTGGHNGIQAGYTRFDLKRGNTVRTELSYIHRF